MLHFAQGGTFVFRGPRLLWAHYDNTPGDYADMGQVLRVVQEEKQRQATKQPAALASAGEAPVAALAGEAPALVPALHASV